MIAWVEDKPGVLNRVSGLFGRRSFNIESLTVGHTEKPGISRMTFVVKGTQRDVQQVRMQLYKLVRADSSTRGEIMQLVDIYRAQVVDVDINTVIIRIVAREDRVDALLRLLEQFGIKEMVRTGRVAMVRGSRVAQKTSEMVMAGNGRAIEV
jgi:acetolactate synthase-1/3 small subunit